jgi:hypothetical protein
VNDTPNYFLFTHILELTRNQLERSVDKCAKLMLNSGLLRDSFSSASSGLVAILIPQFLINTFLNLKGNFGDKKEIAYTSKQKFYYNDCSDARRAP